MNSHKQNFVYWPSVGPQDIKHKQTNKFMNDLLLLSLVPLARCLLLSTDTTTHDLPHQSIAEPKRNFATSDANRK